MLDGGSCTHRRRSGSERAREREGKGSGASNPRLKAQKMVTNSGETKDVVLNSSGFESELNEILATAVGC